jgi:type IV pilus assembly protein PilA
MFINKVKLTQSGFTLVELMVVVAIIGLLSAVAIPNFQKYQARSKTPEAKLQLAAIYTAEAGFYASYNIYHNCLRFMGYDPSAEKSSRYFTVGFNMNVGASGGGLAAAVYATAENSGLSTTECTMAGLAGDGDTMFLAGKYVAGGRTANGADMPVTSVGAQADDATMTYTAGAGGIVHKKFTTTSNSAAMTIDHLKVIKIIRNGF